MKEVAVEGVRQARHLRGELYEVRVYGRRVQHRLIFVQETKYILLLLHVFGKHTPKTPPADLEIAERRLNDWRTRKLESG